MTLARPLTVALVALASLVPRSAAAQTPTLEPARVERVAVAWDDPASGAGRVALAATRAPWELVTAPVATGPAPLLATGFDRLLAISTAAGTISVIDLASFTVEAVFDLGPASRPVDVALASRTVAYVARERATTLLRLDLATGSAVEVCDLAPLADQDGVPDQGELARFEGRLFVTLRRVSDLSPPEPDTRPAIAVMDLATETLVDADPDTPGVQAVGLFGTAPKRGLRVERATRRLWVNATGAFHDGGGLEVVDLDALRSTGLAVAEHDGTAGADVTAFVLVAPTRGFLSFSTDFAPSSHLSTFDASGAVEPVPDLHSALGYLAPALAHAPGTDVVFFPEAGMSPPGYQVFDAATGVRLTPRAIATSGPPTDLALVRVPPRAAERVPR